jgi:hypothetical protein
MLTGEPVLVARLANESGKVWVVTRPTATLITMATVVLCAGCGGGSNKVGANTIVQVGPRPIVAKDGEFQTMIPRGYAIHPSSAQYWADGPEEAGFITSVLVVREAVSKKLEISTYARRLLRAIRTIARRVSHLKRLSVGAEPAFAFDYFVTGTGTAQGKLTHVRQVLVKHGPWVWFIRDVASPAQYAASLGALDEVLRNWRWR